MSVKPMNARHPWETRETLWMAIRKLKRFTVADLYPQTDLDKSTVQLYLRSLVKAEILTRTERNTPKKEQTTGRFQPSCVYELAKDSMEPPRVRKDGTEVTQGAGRTHMWRSMKTLKRFTLSDLTACSSTRKKPVACNEAATYLKFLVVAGYVERMDTKPLERAVFALANWTGPKAPMIQRVKKVWDPNLKKVVWPLPEGESK